MDELITWLRAQLDEDERVARAAHVGPWRTEPADSVYVQESAVVHHPGPLPSWATTVVPPDSEGGAGIEPADAEHVARWDPARVQAEVEAKRRILARHEQCGTGHGYCDDGGHSWELDSGTPVCPDKLDLAHPYAGREGWREEWAPDTRPE